MSRFIHPTHARGVQGRNYDHFTLGVLTDSAYIRYAATGRYGSAMQARYSNVPKRSRKSTTKPKPVYATDISELL